MSKIWDTVLGLNLFRGVCFRKLERKCMCINLLVEFEVWVSLPGKLVVQPCYDDTVVRQVGRLLNNKIGNIKKCALIAFYVTNNACPVFPLKGGSA